MATIKNITPESIIQSARAKEFAPVYYLMGQEPYYIDRICDCIVNEALQPEERDFNLMVMYGADTTAGQVIDAAKRYPMMAERQVVLVKDAQNLKHS